MLCVRCCRRQRRQPYEGQSREEKTLMARNHSDRLETVPPSLQLRIAVQMEILFRTLSRLSLWRYERRPSAGDGKSDRCDFSRDHAKREGVDSSLRTTQCRRVDKFDFLYLPAHFGSDYRAYHFLFRQLLFLV